MGGHLWLKTETMKQAILFFALLVVATGCTSEDEAPHNLFPQLQSLTAENLSVIPRGDTIAIDVKITGTTTSESAPFQEAWIVWENNTYSGVVGLERRDYDNKTPVDIIDKHSFEARLAGVKKFMLLTVYFKTNAGYTYSAVYGYNTVSKYMQLQSGPIKSK